MENKDLIRKIRTFLSDGEGSTVTKIGYSKGLIYQAEDPKNTSNREDSVYFDFDGNFTGYAAFGDSVYFATVQINIRGYNSLDSGAIEFLNS